MKPMMKLMGDDIQDVMKDILLVLKTRADNVMTPLQIVSANYCAMEIRKLHIRQEKANYNPVISVCACLAQEGYIDCDQFLKFLCDSMEYIPLELVWHLHTSRVVDIAHYLQTIASFQVNQKFVDLLLEAVDQENNNGLHFVTDLLCALVMHSLLEDNCKVKTNAAQKIANQVVDEFFQRYLEMLALEKTCNTNPFKCLNIYKLMRNTNTVTHEVLCKFYKLQLTHLLAVSPVITATFAITEQSNWTLNKTPNTLTDIFSELIVPFTAQDIITIIKHLLESRNANWRMVLPFLSIFVAVTKECGPYFECIINELLQDAFTSSQMDNLFACFLIVRHIGYEGFDTDFPSYSTWFLNTFGTPTKTVANTTKKLEFLLKFLSELVPFESAKYLRIHILQPPYSGRKSRELVRDYVLLAKTRLKDLKETLDDDDDPGTNIIPFRIPDAERRKVEKDVENAVECYKSTGKLPAFVMEMSIFNVSYFKGNFIRYLLKPRILPEVPDAKMKLIAHLLRLGKIAAIVYSEYEKACQNEKSNVVKVVTHPLDILRSILRELETLSESFEHNMTEIFHCIDKLTAAMLQVTNCEDGENKSIILIDVENPSPGKNKTLVHLLLNTFCKMTAHGSTSHFNLLPKWSSKFAAVIGNSPSIHFELYNWIWHTIIFKEMQNLHPYHVEGLAAFLQYINVLKECNLPLVKLSLSMTKRWEFFDAICTHLPVRKKEHMISSFRFIIASVSHAIFISSTSSIAKVPVLPVSLYKKFQFLYVRFLQLQKQFQMRNLIEGVEQLLNSARVLYNSQIIKECIKDNSLTFDEWVMYECNVDDHFDFLNESCKNDYRVRCIESRSWPKFGNSYTDRKCSDILKLLGNKSQT